MSASAVARISAQYSTPTFAAAAAALAATAAVGSGGGSGSSSKPSSFVFHPADANLVRPIDPTCCAPPLSSRPLTLSRASLDSHRLSLPATRYPPPAYFRSSCFNLLPSRLHTSAPQFLPENLLCTFQGLGGVAEWTNRPAHRLILPSINNRVSPQEPTPSSPSASFQPPLPSTNVPSRAVHTWHFPSPGVKPSVSDPAPAGGGGGGGGREGGEVGSEGGATVVLLGWLGAKQRNLRRYADFYNGHGIHAVTFVVPMKDLVATFKIGQRAEEHVDDLVAELERWLDLDNRFGTREGDTPPRVLIFHTFSNTGWLVYGAVLKRLKESHGSETIDRLIKGCVVDSAPAPNPTPQVWAAGFCTALLDKKIPRRARPPPPAAGVVEEGGVEEKAADVGGGVGDGGWGGRGEGALRAVLEKFFSVFLKLPAVKDRLEEVVSILREDQPKCPQLYIYSSSDKVIPAEEVEAFMGHQRKKGHVVISRKLQDSPHVDHFRTFPEIYMGQLREFLGHCFPQWSFGKEESFETSPTPQAGA